MRKSVIWSITGGLAVLATATTVATVALNQPPVNNSTQSVRFFYQGQYRDSSYKFNWDSNAIGANSATDINSMFSCPAKSTDVFTFLSLRGQELQPDGGWQAFGQTSFFHDTKDVLTPNLKPAGLINGSPGARYSRDHGGDFSLGLACTHNQGKIVDSVSYRFISVTAHSGQWQALSEPQLKTANGDH